MKGYIQLILLTSLAALIHGCIKVEQVPSTPSIEFTSFEIFDTLDILGNNSKAGRLLFRFEDGDGDLGLTAPANDNTDTTNFHITLFRKENGSMSQVTSQNDPLLPYASYRIPYMERLGQNQILRGTIAVTLMYQSYNDADTIKYSFYIKDRADNYSNTEETSEIIVAKNSIYTKDAR